MPPPIHLPVVVPGLLPVLPRRNHRPGAAPVKFTDRPVGVERPVPDHRPEGKALQKLRHNGKVVRLAGQDHEPHGLAERVRKRDGLAGQTAPGAADSLAQGSPWRAGGLPVRLDDGAVDGQVFKVELFGQSPENTPGNTGPRPAAEPFAHTVPLAETFRKVPSGRPDPLPPEHRCREKPVVLCGASGVGFPVRKNVFDTLPHEVGQHCSVGVYGLYILLLRRRFGALRENRQPNRRECNPQCQQDLACLFTDPFTVIKNGAERTTTTGAACPDTAFGFPCRRIWRSPIDRTKVEWTFRGRMAGSVPAMRR